MENFSCSFCGSRRRDVEALIAGPRIFICSKCVATCEALGRARGPAKVVEFRPAPQQPLEAH
jgi:ATP-dependent protease Clp ATPase subunit